MGDTRWDDERLARIVALGSEASLQPDRWTDLVGEICTALSANGAVLVTPGLDPEGSNLGAAVGSAQSSLIDYVTRWAPLDPWWQRLGGLPEAVTSGSCIVGEELLSRNELVNTAFYNDFSRLHEIDSVATMLICNGQGGHAPPTQLSVFRSFSGGAFEAQDKLKLQAIWPHLQRAIETYWTLRKARDFDRIAEGALDAVSQPAWVLRQDLTVDHANRAARDLMASMPWLRVGSNRLTSIGDLDSAALRELVRSAPFGAARAWVAVIPEGGRLRRCVLRVAPLRGVAPFATAWPHAHALLTLELPFPDDANALWSSRVAAHFRLTPAEARVLARLCAGLSPQEIASEMGVAYTTTRAHLRALFDKTGCHRQADLVRLGLGG